MIKAKIFRAAAELIVHNGNIGACTAIYYVCRKLGFKYSVYIKHKLYFQNILKPDNTPSWQLWYGEFNNQNRLARTLGLLLCVELAKNSFVPDKNDEN